LAATPPIDVRPAGLFDAGSERRAAFNQRIEALCFERLNDKDAGQPEANTRRPCSLYWELAIWDWRGGSVLDSRAFGPGAQTRRTFVALQSNPEMHLLGGRIALDQVT